MNSVQFKPPYTVSDSEDVACRRKFDDISIGNWLFTFFILLIPLVNITMLCIWSFSEKINFTKRSFCRAMLIVTIAVYSLAISAFCVLKLMNRI